MCWKLSCRAVAAQQRATWMIFGLSENGYGIERALQGMIAPQSSFKARSGPLQYMAGSAFGAGFGGPCGVGDD